MRILHVINNLETGGAQRLVADMAALQSAGNDVSLLVLSDAETEFSQKVRNSGVRILSLHAGSLRNPLLVRPLRRMLKGFDVVHVHLFPAFYWVALASARMKRRPALVYTEHNTTNRRRKLGWLKGIERKIYQCYNAVACISCGCRESLLGWVPSLAAKTSIVFNGIDLDKFSRAASQPAADPDEPVIVMVSRFSKQKDQDALVRALACMKQNARIRLVGDGERLGQVRELASSLGVGDKVEFLGNRDDVPEILSKAQIGVQASHWEGFGLTAVEFMAAGVPMVATDVPGLSEVVGGNGLLFPESDHVKLAGILDSLLADKSMRDSYRDKGLKRALDLSIEKTCEEYLALYRRVLEK